MASRGRHGKRRRLSSAVRPPHTLTRVLRSLPSLLPLSPALRSPSRCLWAWNHTQLFMYKSRNKNDDVFTATNLKAMCDFEATLINYDNFQNYCLLTDGNCTSPATSIVTYFYGDNLTKANGNWDCYTLPSDRISGLATGLVDYMDTESGQLNYGFFMAGNTVKKGFSAWTRSGRS